MKELEPPRPSPRTTKLHEEIESIKAQLNSIAHHHKHVDDITTRGVKKYYSEKNIDKMFGHELHTIFPTNAFVITLAAILLVGGVFYLASSNPEMTGAAITGVAEVAGHQMMATSAGMFVIIIILGLVLHRADYHHKHKHDKYKHPSMRE